MSCLVKKVERDRELLPAGGGAALRLAGAILMETTTTR